ncbi:hypothetical protein HELRODRAFT_186014 [Helobdella robusta]|uniref:Solute carrier family 25 member 32 n=1 Tax=Helobdella robusta TaxID=6412 RepID=T1FNJ8_HELRO|nr:hypothetical protein HELRODRAFT_186014 [Helobdella robusta]ESN95002.1 hypothetical protein HELRODRAFT_186014 [Helobdella robusta]
MSPTASVSSPNPSATTSLLRQKFFNLKQCPLISSIKWEHLVAGVSGGVISTVVLHPLDLIKIRLQVNEGKTSQQPSLHSINNNNNNAPIKTTTTTNNLDPLPKVVRPQYKGMLDAGVSIVRVAGLRGLYQGAVPNIVGAGSAWGLYFFAYNTLKSRRQNGRRDIALNAHVHMSMATQAGIFTLLTTNPIWVAKTRLCLQYDQTNSARRQFSKNDSRHYRGLLDCLVKTYKYEGIAGLYKGLVPGLVGVSHGALQFMAYEELKKFYNSSKQRPHDAKLGTKEYLCFAAISKIFAASTTYPYQVVRSRLQDQHRKYNGVVHVLKETYRYEGWRGFFKGLVPGVTKVTPACCITFLVYEHVIQLLQQQQP